MARIEIKLPEKFVFSVDIPVRSTDINTAGHLSWNNMFHILDDANVRFWKSLAIPRDPGSRLSRIAVDAGINYKQQAFHGQTLRVEVGLADVTARGFDIIFKVTDAETGAEVARAKQGVLYFDYETQKVATMPQALRDKLTQ